ncbi:MAG: cellulase family glycosylhydrolase [Ardenticatenaceae bacterium]|nr:cellulase family glycosylhydrolase [Ardenticatenaceae bacterium]
MMNAGREHPNALFRIHHALLVILLLVLPLTGCRSTPGPPPVVTLGPSPTAAPSPAPSPTPAPPFPLFFASDRAGQAAIYRLGGDGQPHLVTTNPGGAWNPAVRPGGADSWPTGPFLAFTTYAANNGDIALVSAGGGTPMRIVTNPADDYQPTWSPDGTRLAFVSERNGGQDLYLVRPERPDEELRLTADSGLLRHRYPAWTPDGRGLIFAGVDSNGVEELYRLDLTDASLTALTAWPLKATMPAVSPTGEIAFIGWQDSPTRTLSVLPPDGGPPRTLLTSDRWIAHPAWSADGRWLLYTAWQDPAASHELYAIPAAGGESLRLTTNAAWDDVAAPLPGSTEAGPPRERTRAPGELPPTRSALMLGFNIADLNHAYLIRDLGGTWVKGFVDWARTEPERGTYDWRDADNTVRGAEDAGLVLFLRLHNAPVWSHPGRAAPSTPPDDPADFARFAAAVTARYRGRVAAYELWNEPNLAFEWGNAPPDPAGYVALLRAAYPAIKAVTPAATVVAGALSSTGGGSAAAMGDLDYLAAMYAAGAARGVTHDAIATHPYGFGKPPDAAADSGLGLRHVEAQRAVMVAAGDEASLLWITETGWPVKAPAWDLGEHAAWALNFTTQAAFYALLPATVARQWPFVAALFPFNLDFSTVAWYPAGQQMRAYALLNPDGSPRPAYTALRRALRR